MEEARKIVKKMDTDGMLRQGSDVSTIATALHSIQAQTIREMVKVAREVPTFDISEGVTRDRFIDALKSYAKDKGIEIE